MRMIDADALIETIENHPTSVPCGVSLDISRGKMQMLKQVLDDIRNAPTVSGWLTTWDDKLGKYVTHWMPLPSTEGLDET